MELAGATHRSEASGCAQKVEKEIPNLVLSVTAARRKELPGSGREKSRQSAGEGGDGDPTALRGRWCKHCAERVTKNARR